MTFSITAIDPDTDKTGVAIASVFPAVGAVCPWVSEHVALSTQAWDAGATYGEPALDMVAHELSLPTAAEALLNERAGAEGTQLHGIEATGRSFGYTGEQCEDWAGHHTGDHHTVAGNTLVGPAVIDAMQATFKTTDGPFEERLLSALTAGEAAGGDKRGDNLSAALLVRGPTPKLYHNLRVDTPGEPIADLRTAYETARETEANRDESRLREIWGDDYPDSIVEFPIRY